MKYTLQKGRYGLIDDGIIVKILAWTDCDCCEQEIYFSYRFFDKLKFRRDVAWIHYGRFTAFANKVKTLKKQRKTSGGSKK